jgi:Mn2+/Fe2+ NRAMP family transporter
VKQVLGLFLGVLTAIGGFVDIGDLVTQSVVGSRFGLSLVWVTVLSVIGIVVFAQMSGRVAAVSKRATFEIIRERLGPRLGFANLGASFLINLLTLTAEIGGIALALQLATSIAPGLWIPVAAVALWIVLWRVKFKIMENVVGLVGLCLVAFTVAVFLLNPDWGRLGHSLVPSVPSGEHPSTYWYYAISLFGAGLTPYEVFFFSSGAREEKWTPRDLSLSRANVFLGFPLGGAVSLSNCVCATLVLLPLGIQVSSLSQVVLPVAQAGGAVLGIVLILGIVAATFGAALETCLSSGYTIAQYFGWSWGKFRRPAQAARFHVVLIVSLLVALGVLATGADPVQVTEASVVLSALALPLTYLPILIVANDRQYMGEHVNGRVMNAFGLVFLALIVVASVASIPLLIISGMGA